MDNSRFGSSGRFSSGSRFGSSSGSSRFGTSSRFGSNTDRFGNPIGGGKKALSPEEKAFNAMYEAIGKGEKPLKGIAAVVDVLSRTNYAAANTAIHLSRGEGVKSLPHAFMDGLKGKDKVTFSDLLDQRDPEGKGSTRHKAVGFAMDMFFDPLNAVGFGEYSKLGEAIRLVESAKKAGGIAKGSKVAMLADDLVKAGKPLHMALTAGEQARQGTRNLVRLRVKPFMFAGPELEIAGLGGKRTGKAAGWAIDRLENAVDLAKGTRPMRDLDKLFKTRKMATPLIKLQNATGLGREEISRAIQANRGKTDVDFAQMIGALAKKSPKGAQVTGDLARDLFRREQVRQNVISKAGNMSLARNLVRQYEDRSSALHKEAVDVAKKLGVTKEEVFRAQLQHEGGYTGPISKLANTREVKDLVAKRRAFQNEVAQAEQRVGIPYKQLTEYDPHVLTPKGAEALRTHRSVVNAAGNRVTDLNHKLENQLKRTIKGSILEINRLAKQGKLKVDGRLLNATQGGELFTENPYAALLVRTSRSAQAQAAYKQVADTYREFGVQGVPVKIPWSKGKIALHTRNTQAKIDKMVSREAQNIFDEMANQGFGDIRQAMGGKATDNELLNVVTALSDRKAISTARKALQPGSLEDRFIRYAEGRIGRDFKVSPGDWTDLQKRMRQLVKGPTDKVLTHPDGYVQLRGLKDASGHVLKGTEGMYLPKGVANEMLSHWQSVQGQEKVNSFVHGYDTVLSKFKSWNIFPHPAYTARNLASNLWNLVNHGDLDAAMLPDRAVKARAIQTADRSVTNAAKTLTTDAGQKVTYGDLRRAAQDYGVLGTGFLAGDVSRNAEKILNEKTNPMQWLIKQNTTVEDHSRLMMFVDRVQKGYSFEDAAEAVNKVLYDVGDMTEFESKWMKRIFPYYSWQRKNAEMTLKELGTRPGRIATPLKIQNAMTDDSVSQKDMPPWLTEELPVSRGGQVYPSASLYPGMEGMKAMANPIGWALDNATPLYKMGMILGLGRDPSGFYALRKDPKEAPVYDGGDVNKFLTKYGKYKPDTYMGVKSVNVPLAGNISMTPWMKSVIQNTPVIGRFTGERDRWLKERDSGESPLRRVMSYTTGIRHYQPIKDQAKNSDLDRILRGGWM